MVFIGWTYEARIYRKRMSHILGKMFEMHGKGMVDLPESILTRARS